MPCSKSCGNGTMRRFRYCTNPLPKYNGNYCTGNNYEEMECYTDCSKGIKTLL